VNAACAVLPGTLRHIDEIVLGINVVQLAGDVRLCMKPMWRASSSTQQKSHVFFPMGDPVSFSWMT
jgi:hypothetical protein